MSAIEGIRADLDKWQESITSGVAATRAAIEERLDAAREETARAVQTMVSRGKMKEAPATGAGAGEEEK